MSKKKRKLKKLLKGLGVGAAILGAGKALMNRRDKANQMKEFLATEGGDLSNMTTRPNMLDIAGPIVRDIVKPKRRKSILADPRINKMDTSEVDLEMPPVINRRISGQSVMASPRLNTGAFDIGLKDGGKVVKTGDEPKKRKKKIGIQIKGFGKARKT
jgi:hypothetical protein